MRFLNANPQAEITAGRIAKYMLLPGILPRLKNLSFTVSRLLFIFVQILGSVGLIEKNHPCLQPENIGRYGFGQIVAMAWDNLKLDRQHIPQAIMFFSVIGAVILMAAMVLIGGVYLFSGLGSTAHAQYFSTPNTGAVTYDKNEDWAFQFLERIFGGKEQTGLDFWVEGSNTESRGKGNPWFTSLLIGMLKTYSQALLFIAVIMILYLIVITLAEAARSGKPFGEKFDSIWAPIRFAIAIGLLIPISGSGYNGAQMIAFQVAEWGSNLATGLWHHGIETIGKSTAQGSENKNYVAANISDPGYRFVRDMFLINLCVFGYNDLMVQGKMPDIGGRMNSVAYVTEKSSGSSTIYMFGKAEVLAPDFCGTVEIRKPPAVPAGYLADAVLATSTSPARPARTEANFLPAHIARNYNDAAANLMPVSSDMQAVAAKLAKGFLCDRTKKFLETKCDGPLCAKKVQNWVYGYWKTAFQSDANNPSPENFMVGYNNDLAAYNDWITESLKKDAAYGWASAGVFYLRMSYALSVLSDALNNQPRVTKLPENVYKSYATVIDPDIEDKKAREDCGTKEGEPICAKYKAAEALSQFLTKGASFFAEAPKYKPDAETKKFYRNVGGYTWDAALKMSDKEAVGANSFGDVMGPVQTFLFNNLKISSGSLNPLGQVINWGNTFINVAGIAYAFSIVMGIVGLFPFAGVATSISSFAYMVGTMFIIPGFILMFVVPLLPFLYFTFAVVEWVVSIAEAVIGMPLWALSFISLEGDLAGKGKEGAKMLFDIMLRPTIIVFSLISSILIFTAAIGFFNNSIELYLGAYHTGNAANSNTVTDLKIATDAVGGIGMMFVYMFGVYSLATSCFKLIDNIPNLFGRWLGLQQGFGASIRMGAQGGEIALASAIIVKQGAGLVAAPLQAAGGKIRQELTAREDREQDRRYREGGELYDRDVWGRKMNVRQTEGEFSRIDRANAEAASFNEELGTINAMRRAAGKSELDMKQYQRMPEERRMKYFRAAVVADMRGIRQGPEFYSDPAGTGAAGSGTAGSMPGSSPTSPTTPPTGSRGLPNNTTSGGGSAGGGNTGGGSTGGGSTASESSNSTNTEDSSVSDTQSIDKERNRREYLNKLRIKITQPEIDTAYQILGVSRGTDISEIRRKYLKIAQENHPDINPNDQRAEEVFKKAAEAYDLLLDLKEIGMI